MVLAEVTSPLKGEWMTPRRRFLSAVYRGNVDKVPACTLSRTAPGRIVAVTP